MTTKNVAASVRARLTRIAKERGDVVEMVFTRYANERLLHRLALSPHAGMFVLKGAALFTVWTGNPHRTTRDMDFLGFGAPDASFLAKAMREIVSLDVEDDGVRFDAASVDAGPIREDQLYGGVRVLLDAYIGNAKIRLQVDIGFGDPITPAAVDVEFPPLLAGHGPRLKAYPKETVVAEKLDAMVSLGSANSRMKDFYDVVILSRLFEFEGAIVVDAIRATFGRRGTPLPNAAPVALTPLFATDATKLAQWQAFVRKSGAQDAGTLSAAIMAVAGFLAQPLAAASGAGSWTRRWPVGGPWT